MKNLVLLVLSLFVLTFPAFGQTKTKVRLLTAADLPRKIAAAEPRPLPQTPKVKRVSSDAKDEALKGKVKSVIEWSYEGKRKDISEEKYFDEDGYLTRSVSYTEGYPESITVYGFLDGMRVLRSNDVEYVDGEKRPSRAMILGISAEDNAIDPQRTRDTRYKMREEYIYDNKNRLIEKRSYQNNGEIWHRNTYAYETDDLRISKLFGNDGSQWTKSADTLDPTGNVVREEGYDDKDKVADVNVSTYVLDEKGNWTKRSTFEEKTVGKLKVRRLLWTMYRTIVYYR